MKKIIILGIMIVLMIGLASASSFIFKRGDPIDLSLPAYDRYKTPLDSASNCEVTIKYPNSSVMIASQTMTYQNADKQFHYIIDSKYTSIIGEYPVETRCTNSVDYGSAIYSYEITGNGKDKAGAGVIVLFSIIFIILFGTLIYLMISTIPHVFMLDFNLMDVIYNWGWYLGLMAVNMLEYEFLGNLMIEDMIGFVLNISAFTNVIIPLLAFLLSITVGQLTRGNIKKKEKERWRRNM